MTDEELVARLRENQSYEWQDPIWETRLAAADRIEALTDELAIAKWLLTDAAVQLEEGKIKTRRNRAGLIWQFLEEIKAT